jgi:hypothetical protein
LTEKDSKLVSGPLAWVMRLRGEIGTHQAGLSRVGNEILHALPGAFSGLSVQPKHDRVVSLATSPERSAFTPRLESGHQLFAGHLKSPVARAVASCSVSYLVRIHTARNFPESRDS